MADESRRLITVQDFMALPHVAGLEDHGQGHVTVYVSHGADFEDFEALQLHIRERQPKSLRVGYTRDRRTLHLTGP